MRSPANHRATSRDDAPGNLRQATVESEPKGDPPADLPPDHLPNDFQGDLVGGRQASDAAKPTAHTPADLDGAMDVPGPILPAPRDFDAPSVAAAPIATAARPLDPATQLPTPQVPAPGSLPPDQPSRDAQKGCVGGDLPEAITGTTSKRPSPRDSLNGDQGAPDVHGVRVAESDGNGHIAIDGQGTDADPSDALLLVLADSLDDLEKVRIATENRLRSLTAEPVNAHDSAKGLSGTKVAAKMEEILAGLQALEHDAELELKRAMRAHPFGPFVKRTKGLGEKQGARLLAAIGDPGWNGLEGRPRRGPYELFAYCGYAPEQKRRKGVKSNWNAAAKMRAYLCAEKLMMQPDTEYREVYLRARANWAETHPDATKGHSHNHGLRLVAKHLLKELWRESRATREPMGAAPANGGGQRVGGDQTSAAPSAATDNNEGDT